MLTNRKPEHRRGKVQLVDATQWFKPLRKNLGKKNCELSDADIQRICDTFMAFEETEQSKVFPNAAFGYWKITVERPLRLKVDMGEERRLDFRKFCVAEDEEPIANVVDRVAPSIGPGPHLDFNVVTEAVEADVEKHSVKLTAKRKKMVQTNLAERDELAREVIARVHKPGKVEPDPLRGLFEVTVGGKGAVVEYEPDPDLRDTEQVPLLEPGVLRHSCDEKCCPTPPMPGTTRTAFGLATR